MDWVATLLPYCTLSVLGDRTVPGQKDSSDLSVKYFKLLKPTSFYPGPAMPPSASLAYPCFNQSQANTVLNPHRPDRIV